MLERKDDENGSELDFSSAIEILDALMVPLSVFRTDDSWIVYSNDEFVKSVGYSRAELLGKKFDELIDARQTSLFKDMCQLATQSRAAEEEFTLKRKSGRSITGLLKTKPIESASLFIVIFLQSSGSS